MQFEADGVTRVPEPDADEDIVPVDDESPVMLKTEQYALKTLKTVVNAVVDLWVQQDDHPVIHNGVTFYRGTKHPRSAAVKSLLQLHRVFIAAARCNLLTFLDFSSGGLCAV